MNKDRKDEKIGWFLPTLIFCFVLSAWGTSWFLLQDVEKRGTFGDMFGAVNALFSGLAFGGVIFAILLQMKELKLQRKELELTRGELEGQKEQLKAQNFTLKKQNFEATFFQLLRLQNDITNNTDIADSNNRITSKGRDCFRELYGRFSHSWGKSRAEHQDKIEINRINKTYLAFYERYQSDLGHYFRSLYNIIKLIENSELDDKQLYTNLVRAQLSSFELTLLFYNALSDMGNEKFKPLIEKYALLKNLPKKELLNLPDHLLLYNDSAYGS